MWMSNKQIRTAMTWAKIKPAAKDLGQYLLDHYALFVVAIYAAQALERWGQIVDPKTHQGWIHVVFAVTWLSVWDRHRLERKLQADRDRARKLLITAQRMIDQRDEVIDTLVKGVEKLTGRKL